MDTGPPHAGRIRQRRQYDGNSFWSCPHAVGDGRDWTQGAGKIRQVECSTRSMQRSFFECAYHPGRSLSQGHSICDSPEQEMAWEKPISLQTWPQCRPGRRKVWEVLDGGAPSCELSQLQVKAHKPRLLVNCFWVASLSLPSGPQLMATNHRSMRFRLSPCPPLHPNRSPDPSPNPNHIT